MNDKTPEPLSSDIVKRFLSNPYAIIYLDESSSITNFVRVKNLSKQEYEDFHRVKNTINDEILQYNDLFLMVATAHSNFLKSYQARVELVRNEDKLISAREDLVELNTHFVSLIANFSMYLACVPKKISSSRNDVYQAHITATKEEYDGHFSYRLITSLRNYSLHHTPPITGIKGSKTINEEAGYDIYIEKKELLKDSQIANKLSKDFLMPNDYYPVLENVNEAVACLSRIHWKTIKNLCTEASSSLDAIRLIKEVTMPMKKQPYVAKFLNGSNGTGIDIQLEFVPTQAIDIYNNSQKY